MSINFADTKQRKVVIGIVILLLILFLFSINFIKPLFTVLGFAITPIAVFTIFRLLYWVCLIWLWFYATKVEGQKLLLWKEQPLKFMQYLKHVPTLYFSLIGGMVILGIIMQLTHQLKESQILFQLVKFINGNVPVILLTCVTAAVVEEVIFRGYLLPRLTIMFKSEVWAITVSSVLFGLLHYKYGTLVNVLGPIFIGAVFAYYYYHYRNIKAIIICHFLWDFIAMMFLSFRLHH